ncbi:MAG: hypothetical protein R2716_10565 [Microthrixaceae bacterium]
MPEVVEDLLVVELAAGSEDADPHHELAELSGIPFEHHRPDHRLELRHLGVVEPLAEPEVEERDLSPGAEQVVARVRVAVERAQRVDRPEHEAVEGLGRELALVVRPREDLGEPGAARVVRGQHPLGAQLLVDRGHVDEGVSLVGPGEQELVVGLAAVVELLEQALAQLLDDGLGIEAREQQAQHREQQVGVREVRPDRIRHARVLNLDRHLPALRGRGAVDLSDRGRRDGLGVPAGEDLTGVGAELLAQHGLGELGAHRRGIGLELREGLAHRFGQALVEVAGHLAELHQGALHVPESLRHLLGRAKLEGLAQLDAPLRGCEGAADPRGRVVGSGPGGHPGHARGATCPRGRDGSRALFATQEGHGARSDAEGRPGGREPSQSHRRFSPSR